LTRARLGRYALWQLRDYLFERGIAVVVIGIVFTSMAWAAHDELAGSPVLSRQAAEGLLGSMLPQVALFGTLLAANGVVANDLRQGYFRFLFAKPVGAPRYYAQAFVVNGIGLAALAAAVGAALGAVTGRPLVAPMVLYTVLHFVSLGAVIFLASTVSISVLGRFDWLAASVLWFGARFVHAMSTSGQEWARLLLPLLPPSWRTEEIYPAVMGSAAWPAGAALHLLGYGAVCFLLGLVVLRHRPLAA
jgi:hypothetical protein